MPVPLGIPDLPSQVLCEQTHLSLPSQPHWIQPAVEFLVQKAVLTGACHQSRSGRLLLTLHEAITNALVHGNLEIDSRIKETGDDTFARTLAERAADPVLASRVVDIFVDYNGEVCRWVITDQGKGFDVDEVLSRALREDPDTLLESGRGILLMRAFVDEMRYEFGGRRLILSLNRTNGAEKRKEPRLPIHQPLSVSPLSADGTGDWGCTREAISRNISDTGVSLLTTLGEAGQKVLVGMSLGDQMVYLPAEIRRVRDMPGDIVELGCQFLTTVSEEMARKNGPLDVRLHRVHEALSKMLESRRQPAMPHGERREFQRMIFTEKIEAYAPGGQEETIGFARDLSKGGIAFISQTPMSGELTLVVPAKEHGPSIRVHCQIVRCVRVRDGFYDVAAKFLNLEPSQAADS